VTTLDGAVYTYDAAGNRTSKADQRTGATSNYTYDPIYQLTQVTQGSSTTESYTYDLVGNRLSSLGMSPYNYNSSNQLTSTPAATYTYDKNGNVKTKVDATGTITYNWDYYTNKLTSVVLPNGGGTVSFKYDPFGRRIQKSGPGGTTNYLYDGMNLLEEVDQSGNVLARYTQGSSVDEELSELRASTTSYYEADGLNSITSLSSAAGVLANTYTYDSFGNRTASTGTLTNPFQYTGREFDQETGINYYRMRYYDSSSGRFISEDPAAFDLRWPNLYLYVNNSPTGLVDPSGLSPQVIGPFICTWCWEFDQGAAWMWDGYERMRDMKWRKSDKYFHCMANCRATNAGSGGAAAAKIISFFRTDVRSRWTEPTDWRTRADRGAVIATRRVPRSGRSLRLETRPSMDGQTNEHPNCERAVTTSWSGTLSLPHVDSRRVPRRPL
jgi:RHS repeat-associated protein